MTRHPTARALSFAVATVLLALPATSLAQAVNDDWQPAQLVPVINDDAAPDGCPIESPNGHYLYIASARSGGFGSMDIWRAFRGSKESDWHAPEQLPAPINSMDADFCPTPLHGRGLLFVSMHDLSDADVDTPDDCDPADTLGNQGDIYLTKERAPGAWDPPLHLGCVADGSGPNFATTEYSPSLIKTPEGTFLYFSSFGDPIGYDPLFGFPIYDHNIYVSTLGPDGFGPPEPVAELNQLGPDDRMPNVRRDGLEIVFSSNRPGGAGSFDVYVATRASTADAWSAPQRLDSEVNTAAGETRATLSGDGRRLHFGRAGQIYRSLRRED